jgi:hypothetical protein
MVLRGQVAGLLAQAAELKSQVPDLAARVSRNSQNSSKPPSSDGLAQPARSRCGRRAAEARAGRRGSLLGLLGLLGPAGPVRLRPSPGARILASKAVGLVLIPFIVPEISRITAALNAWPLPPPLIIHWDAWTCRHQTRAC